MGFGKGKKNPNYGRDMSGKNNPFYKHRHTLETRKLMVSNHADFSGKNHPQYGLKGSDSFNFGSKRSKKQRKRMTEAQENRYKDPKEREKTSKALRGRKFTKEHKRNLRGIRHNLTESGRKNLVRAVKSRMKELRQDPNWMRRVIRKISISNGTNFPNKKEKYLRLILNFLVPKLFKYVGDGRVMIGGKNPDFICRRKKKIIELFGVHWHKKGEGQKRKRHFKKNGYDCFIIWDRELRSQDKLAWRILDFVEHFNV